MHRVIIKTQNRGPNNIQKTSPQSYKTQIEILPFPGLRRQNTRYKNPQLQSATKLLTHSPFRPLFRHCDPFFALLAWPFNPPHPQTMLCGNCCPLELQTTNIEWGSGVLFHRLLCGKKNHVSRCIRSTIERQCVTNYVADCC